MIHELIRKAHEAKRNGERGYDSQALDSVRKYVLQCYEEKKGCICVNNGMITQYILEKESIPEELHDHLGFEVFLAQKQIGRESGPSFRDTMLADGYLELSPEIVQEAIDTARSLMLVATITFERLPRRMDGIYKPAFQDGRYYLMRPHSNSTKFPLERFEDAFVKLYKQIRRK